jgi:hypothetical protein
VGPRAGLDGRKNFAPTGIRSRTVKLSSSVAISTQLPGPQYDNGLSDKKDIISTLCNIPEEQISNLHGGGDLKSQAENPNRETEDGIANKYLELPFTESL